MYTNPFSSPAQKSVPSAEKPVLFDSFFLDKDVSRTSLWSTAQNPGALARPEERFALSTIGYGVGWNDIALLVSAEDRAEAATYFTAPDVNPQPHSPSE